MTGPCLQPLPTSAAAGATATATVPWDTFRIETRRILLRQLCYCMSCSSDGEAGRQAQGASGFDENLYFSLMQAVALSDVAL